MTDENPESRSRLTVAKRKAGLPPGALVYLGNQKSEAIRVTVFDYDLQQFEETTLEQLERCADYKEKPSITWINIEGLHDIDAISHLGRLFNIHALSLEDILNTNHSPKLDDHNEYLFVIAKMIFVKSDSDTIQFEHFCLIVGEGYVLTFQELQGDVFNPLRARIRIGKGRIRKLKSDYLAYALIDAIVDNYFVALEKLEEQIEPLESELLQNPTTDSLNNIHNLKKEVTLVRKALRPLREVITTLLKGESQLIQSETEVFLQDLQDHIVQALEEAETVRDRLSSMAELYMSSVSNRLNETMKVLTVMASVFIPLTFVAGIYGMNFEVMPELQWQYGYPLVWLTMIAIAVAILTALKRKKWL